MKSKYIILASALLISVATFAQKEELKTLKKLYEKSPSDKDIVQYKATIEKAEPLIANATEADKVYLNFYKAMIPVLDLKLALAKPENQNKPEVTLNYLNIEKVNQLVANLKNVLDFEKKSGKQIYTKNIEETIKTFKPALVNFAVALGNESKFKEAAIVLHSIYELDNTDTEKLYYSANYAVNAKDYDLALQYYLELKKLNYSGEDVVFYAFNKDSKKEESFVSKQERDIYVKGGTHEKPRDEKSPSKRGEIYKNIALILVEKDRTEEAKLAIEEARKENPEDTSLIISQADLYLKIGDVATYKKLISEVIEKNPNNADMLYNLGVISFNNKELVDAEKYYLRAIQIDPKYSNAYLNLAILKLDSEKKIIDQMNKLGNTPAENKKYDILKKQREDIFKSAIPYLEKVVEMDDKNVEASRTLLNVYNALEMTDKAKVLKAKMAK